MHAEPEFAGAGLVLEDNGAGDAAGDGGPVNVNYTLGGLGKRGEAVGVEVEVVGAAAVVELVVFSCGNFLGEVTYPGHWSVTMAVILLPLGPVTLTQTPQALPLSQLESESAVP